MLREIDLLKNYPKTKRDTSARAEKKTDEDRRIAREFGKEFFDGDRSQGYGGYSYNPRFWSPVVPDFQEFFRIQPGDSILDVGCAKGFMLYDMKRLLGDVSVAGIDISEYAINNALEEMKPYLQVGNAKSLPYEDNSFDFVISITTVHNLEKDELAQALMEIERVAKRGSFITVDAYENEADRQTLEDWVLTAKTVMHVDEWKRFFKEVGYTGAYYWFKP